MGRWITKDGHHIFLKDGYAPAPDATTHASMTHEDAAAAIHGLWGYRNTHVDLAGVDPKALPDIVEGLRVVHQHYQGQVPLESIAAVGRENFASLGHYAQVRGSTKLELSADHFKDKGRLEASLAHEQQTGHLAVGSVKGIVLHELAHVVDLGGQGALEAKQYIHQNPIRHEGAVSRYAMTNHLESFAEGFAKVVATPKDQLTPWLQGLRGSINKDIRRMKGRELQ